MSELPSTKTELAPGLFLCFVGSLLAVGTLMVFSSSFTANPSDEEQIFLSRQLMFLAVAGLAGTLAARVPARAWQRLGPLLFGGSLVLLALVLVPGLGRSVNGAQRWFRFGGISLQPSEIAKLTLPLMICCLRFRSGAAPGQLRELKGEAFAIGLAVFLVVLEPDLGTGLFLALGASLALWLCGVPGRWFVAAGAVASPALLILLALKPYQFARLQGFVATWIRPEEAPYQIQQSLTTLGVGGWTGAGLGRGWQKLSFLPEANTDFVFAVIGEELGLAGTLGVVLLWAGVAATGMQLIRRLPAGSFEAVLATTLLAQLVLQAAINVAVVTALLPPKGISHPFISYGGSNLVSSLIAVGVIVSLTRLPEEAVIRDNACTSGGWAPAATEA